MTVRFRLALTVFLTGLITAVGVLATVAIAFQRFERERSYDRANAFLERVAGSQLDILDMHGRNPDEFTGWMRSLLFFEPDCQLYLLGPDGAVLASSGKMPLAPGFKVGLAPVQQAAAVANGAERMPYVMGDDPERMDLNAVISARELRRAVIRPGSEVAGYLYLVSQQPLIGNDRVALFRSTLAAPAMVLVLGVIGLTTWMAVWIVITVTRPLQQISREVSDAAREGFNAVPLPPPAAGEVADAAPGRGRRRDEFGQLQDGFHQLLVTLRSQWDRLRDLDRFRREGVSNFSHDLRSPLTAAAASLETLQQRWAGDSSRAEDARLVAMALRNTHNAAGLVRSLSDLALLDEPEFRLQPMVVDLGEVLDDIAMRFNSRAAARSVQLSCQALGVQAPHAAIDIELFERAVANLLENALKFTPPGGMVALSSEVREQQVLVVVADTGVGISSADLPHLFDRLYQSRAEGQELPEDTPARRSPVAPASSDEGKGLGLAIVKRIVELHGGQVAISSVPGLGTTVTISLPRALGALQAG